MPDPKAAEIAILYWADPWASLPSGIDSFIRGMLKYAPHDLRYTLIGATAEPELRPIGKEYVGQLGKVEAKLFPLLSIDHSGRRTRIPLTLRYMYALAEFALNGRLRQFKVLDFHRIEPTLLFVTGNRKKNLVIHQDMANLRNSKSDIGWRLAPGLYEQIERPLLRTMNQIYCVRQSAVKRYIELDQSLEKKMQFTPTWMDTDIFKCDPSKVTDSGFKQSLRKQLNISHEGDLLVTVGRLDHQKDPLLLLQTFKRLNSLRSDVHLLMIGDGILRNSVEDLANELGIGDRVTCLGTKPPAEIAQYLKCSDLFVLSSAYEGMPIAVLEALACGLPVVTTDVGEVGLVVKNGVNGRIADDRTEYSLCSAIQEALDNSMALFGRPCIEAVEAYKPETVLAALYENHRRQLYVP